MKNIFLHGKLGERFGRVWALNVSTPTEAINALFANEPLIEKYLNKKQEEGIAYGVKRGKSEGFIEKEEYSLVSSRDIHVFPIPQGAGTFTVNLLIAVATTAASMYISKKMAEAMERDDSTVAIQTKSYLYEGTSNRSQQGGTVPLGYGRLKVGSNVISSCVVNYDYDSDKGDIFNFNSGLYSLVPHYSKYYDPFAGGLGSAFILNTFDGASKFNNVDPAFQFLQGTTPETYFGASQALYGGYISEEQQRLAASNANDADESDGLVAAIEAALEGLSWVLNKFIGVFGGKTCDDTETGETVEGNAIGGYFYYKMNHGKGVDINTLPNWNPALPGSWYPESQTGISIGKWFPYRVSGSLADNSSYVCMQSVPEIDDGSNPEKFFYPITFSDTDLEYLKTPLAPQKKDDNGIFPIQVGQRWIEGDKANGVGWFKMESAAIYKSVDLIGEGPIEGFSNNDGESLEFYKNAPPTQEDKDDYLQGVYLDDTPVKEVDLSRGGSHSASYNINEFDIDVGMNKGKVMGSEDQQLLEPQYLFTANTTTIGKELFGPRLLTAGALKTTLSPAIEFQRNTAYPIGAKVSYQNEGGSFTYVVSKDLSNRFNKNTNYSEGNLVAFSEGEGGSVNFYEATNSMDDYILFNGDYVIYAGSELPLYRGYTEGERVKGKNSRGGTSYYKMGSNAADFLGVFNHLDDYTGKVGKILMRSSTDTRLYKILKDYDSAESVQIESFCQELPFFYTNEAGVEIACTTSPLGLLATITEQFPSHPGGGIVAEVVDITPTKATDVAEELWQEIIINSVKDIQNGLHGPGAPGKDRGGLALFSLEGSDSAVTSRTTDEEYYESHTVINPLVEQAYVTLQVDELAYLYAGDEVEVHYALGALWGAVIGALLAAEIADIWSDRAQKEDKAPAPIPGTPVVCIPDPTGCAESQNPDATKTKGITIGIHTGVIVALGALIGAIGGCAMRLKVGTKIENSGELWPNRAKFRIKYGNEGEVLYKTDIQMYGVATSPYRKDIKIYFPPNVDQKNRIIKVFKLNRERNPIKEGEQAARYKEKSSLAAITEITPIKLSYPNSVVIGTRVNAKDVASVPTRNYNLKLKKVAVPNNYNPETRQYNGSWNGLFYGQSTRQDAVPDGGKYWTDNPAWCLYDMISNKRYGVGRFGIKPEDIDRWTLYKIAKYCDEIIPTGYSAKYNRRTFQLNGDRSIKIPLSTSYDASDLAGQFNYPNKMLALYYSDGTYDSIKIKSIDLGTGAIGLERSPTMGGECAVSIDYPLVEPRYTLNAFLMNSSNAFKLINEFAAIFRTYAYWSNGAINFFQDEKKDPVMLFANNNISKEGFSYSSTPKTSRTNSCKIKYANRYESFRPKMEHREDLRSIEDNNIIEQTIDGFGITSPGQAQRAADFVVKTANLETEIISFETSAIGSYLRPGDVISVLDNKKTVGRFAGKVLNIDISGDGKMAEIDADFPIRAIVDEEDKSTWKKITLYSVSGNQTIGSLDASADLGNKITDSDIHAMRAGQVGEYVVSKLSNNDTRIKIINNPYSFVTGEFTWSQALYDAQDKGGILATINNVTDQSQVQAVLPPESSFQAADSLAWIGGYNQEMPPPERFVWYQPQDCLSDSITYFNWADGFPDVGDPLETDLSSGVVTDAEEFSVTTDSSGGLGNYIAVSGSVATTTHGDWVTLSGNTGIGYILERKANDSLLKLNGAAGSTFMIEDSVNFAEKKTFKVINITEKSNGVFQVQGLQYNKDKFDNIEKNSSLKPLDSPVIFTEKSIDQPTNVSITVMDQNFRLGIPYGLTADWDRVSAAVGYRVQFFDGLILLGTVEVNNDHSNEQQSYTFRNESISEGGSYYARVSSVGA
jgi:predicted phage tail protein